MCHTIQHRAILVIFPLNLQTISITRMLSSGGTVNRTYLCIMICADKPRLFDQWLQDCLAYLLKLMSQFSVVPSDFDASAHDDIFDLLDSPTKKMRKNKPPVEKFVVPRLNRVLRCIYNPLISLFFQTSLKSMLWEKIGIRVRPIPFWLSLIHI